MASLTQWTWVWMDSGSWWWTGTPGVLQFMGSQRVEHDWMTELNWKKQNKQTNKKWNNDNQDIGHQERTVVPKRQGKINWTLFWLNLQSIVHFQKKLRLGNICWASCFPVLRRWNLISGPPKEAWVHRPE